MHAPTSLQHGSFFAGRSAHQTEEAQTKGPWAGVGVRRGSIPTATYPLRTKRSSSRGRLVQWLSIGGMGIASFLKDANRLVCRQQRMGIAKMLGIFL